MFCVSEVRVDLSCCGHVDGSFSGHTVAREMALGRRESVQTIDSMRTKVGKKMSLPLAAGHNEGRTGAALVRRNSLTGVCVVGKDERR